ncbi:uncharacterized protein K452DRAFT_315988 [Aplosporella prunicola CBS 121167]|uniref:Arrestin-like N-terminal domain-containing protein n=1 Tax=Aplosporella prunicola CBS 121167 TaxID=1176127 RepID=A0A6A6BSN5_9PEZI|nr:uncharacterized protein K452DRAFT_315988 [Aplosporella prunicola CBS 121167]KAF2145837.1 hypothetical protein K452DRAFT_315988 [Aplosporella prunicola CBS 121167]
MATSSAEDAFQIVLDNTQTQAQADAVVYSEGDVVRGSVRIDSSRLGPSCVSVSFKGRAISHIVVSSGNNTYKTLIGKSILFQYEAELFAGEDIGALTNANDAFVALPFQFRFPSAVQGARQMGNRLGTQLAPSASFAHSPGHALPPSISTRIAGRI